MFYVTDDKLYLKHEDGFHEVVVTMRSGCPGVIETGETLDKRPVGAKRYSLEELVAQHNIREGVTYPVKAVQSTPSVAPQSGVSPKAQPHGVKPRK